MKKITNPLLVDLNGFEAIKPKLTLSVDGFYAIYKLDIQYVGALSIYFEVNEEFYMLDYYGSYKDRSQIFGASSLYFSFSGEIIGIELDPDHRLDDVPEKLKKK